MTVLKKKKKRMLVLIVTREGPSEKVTVEQSPKAMWLSGRNRPGGTFAMSECGS